MAFLQNAKLLRTNNLQESEEIDTLLENPQEHVIIPVESCYKKTIVVIKDVLLLVLAITTIVILFQQIWQSWRIDAQQQSNSVTPLPGCNCGTSVTQALQLNCKYDTLAAAWLPDHCRDDELTELFNRSGDGPNGTWTYWADFNHTKVLSVDQIGALADLPEGGVFYMTHRWHLVHCMFYWRKHIRSRMVGITLEPRYNTESHVQHCFKMFGQDGKRGAMSGVALNSNRWDTT